MIMGKKIAITLEYLRPSLESMAIKAGKEGTSEGILSIINTTLIMYWDLCKDTETRIELCAFVNAMMDEARKGENPASKVDGVIAPSAGDNLFLAGDIDDMHPWEEGI